MARKQKKAKGAPARAATRKVRVKPRRHAASKALKPARKKVSRKPPKRAVRKALKRTPRKAPRTPRTQAHGKARQAARKKTPGRARKKTPGRALKRVRIEAVKKPPQRVRVVREHLPAAPPASPEVPALTPAQAKTARVMAALEHREGDRVPAGEFFWTNFLRRCKQELSVGGDFNPYKYWDLDLVVVNPNMDPHVTGIQVLEESQDHKVVRTGFGATIESRSDCPMPRFLDFETRTYAQMEALVFDDPADERRYTAAIDDQINGVGDTLNLNLPSFVDRVDACAKDFCVFGSVCEPYEMIWRIMGTDNVLLKIAEGPERIARFIERLGDFMVGIVKAEVAAAKGKLAGLYVWGDVAYDHGMFFSPDYWRRVYKPQVKRICAAIHEAGLKVIYHGCGNARVIFTDLVEAGVDAYNPLEAKAGLDVVELKRQFGSRWAFNGNIDVRVLATNDREKVRREVLRKLNAAKGGGYIFQSDHSIPHNVDPATYDYAIQLLREYGDYPLGLGEFDEDPQ